MGYRSHRDGWCGLSPRDPITSQGKGTQVTLNKACDTVEYSINRICQASALPLELYPQSFLVLVCFSDRVLHFCLSKPWTLIHLLPPLSSWNYRWASPCQAKQGTSKWYLFTVTLRNVVTYAPKNDLKTLQCPEASSESSGKEGSYFADWATGTFPNSYKRINTLY
jgi:hypothetical protein